MTIEFRCDQCGKILRTSDDKAGRQAKCPGCGTLIAIPYSESEQDDAALFDDDLDDEFDSHFGEGDFDPRAGRTKNCPMCGEQIQAAALKCRYCGKNLDEADFRGEWSRRRRSGLAGAALGTGIGSLVFVMCCGCFSIPLGITAITLGFLALSEIKRGGSDGKGMAIAGIICGSLSLLAIVLLLMLQFAIGFNGAQFQQFRR